jgi:hypothetical protein
MGSRYDDLGGFQFGAIGSGELVPAAWPGGVKQRPIGA